MKHLNLVFVFVFVFVLSSCNKENLADFDFLAISEQTDINGAKTRLVGESIVYWESDDAITLCPEGRDPVKASFVYEYNDTETDPDSVFKAIFRTEGDVKVPRQGYFTALFPYSASNVISGNTVQIDFPQEQGYRKDKYADFSFASSACPMVAYGNTVDETDHIVRLLFHNLCGLVRIQIFNSAQGISDVSVSKLTLTSKSNKLSGLFNVNDYDKYNPYLTTTSDSKNSVSLDLGSVSLPATGLTFYIALPAYQGTKTYTDDLTLSVDAKDATGNSLKFSKSIKSLSTRRNGITIMPAISVTSWNEGSTADVTIAGHGTAQRPFLIYTADDLLKVRDACNNGSKLNGVDLSQENSNLSLVYFNIMRSDIKLTADNWSHGFSDFRCRMRYTATQSSSQPGISNSSSHPIFEQISGIVDGIVVNGNFSQTAAATDTNKFSPLCHINKGSIINCAVGSTASYVYTGGQDKAIAGICVYNSGTITGCGCRGILSAKAIAGICYQNNGTVQQCYAASPMQTHSGTAVSASAAGIVFNNLGTVRDCYMAANINKQNTVWGGIVFSNSGTVSNSYLDASGIIQSNNAVGGIVYQNNSNGVIDYCWNDADLIDVNSGGLGGIVHTMNGGEIRNCFRGRGIGSLTCRGGAAGGIVAYLNDGNIFNSYAYTDMSQSTVTRKGTFAGQISGGTIANCYSLSSYTDDNITPFYGYRNGGTISHSYCNLQVTGTIDPIHDYTTLNDNLNAWPSDNSWPSATANTYRQWTQSASTPPTLSTSAFLPTSKSTSSNLRPR